MANLPPLIPIKPDPDELLNGDGALKVKTEDRFMDNSDDKESDPLKENVNHNSDSESAVSELVEGDYPLPLISSLSKAEIVNLFIAHNLSYNKSDISIKHVSQLRGQLQMQLEKKHPLYSQISRLSCKQVADFHDFIYGKDSITIGSKDALQRVKLRVHYFKSHRESPLSSFVRDKHKLQDLLELQNELKVQQNAKTKDHNDPSVVVHQQTPRFELMEELQRYGHNTSQFHHLINEQLIERLEETLRCRHPIHKVINKMTIEEMKVLICYCGDYTKVYGKGKYYTGTIQYWRTLLVNNIFKAKPEAPLSYLSEIQEEYQNAGKEKAQSRFMLKALMFDTSNEGNKNKGEVMEPENKLVPQQRLERGFNKQVALKMGVHRGGFQL